VGGWVGDHPQEDLAKFVSKSELKVEKFRNLYFWPYATNYLSKFGNLAICFSHIIMCLFWAHFFPSPQKNAFVFKVACLRAMLQAHHKLKAIFFGQFLFNLI
jgi:hypothetical protein